MSQTISVHCDLCKKPILEETRAGRKFFFIGDEYAPVEAIPGTPEPFHQIEARVSIISNSNFVTDICDSCNDMLLKKLVKFLRKEDINPILINLEDVLVRIKRMECPYDLISDFEESFRLLRTLQND